MKQEKGQVLYGTLHLSLTESARKGKDEPMKNKINWGGVSLIKIEISVH